MHWLRGALCVLQVSCCTPRTSRTQMTPPTTTTTRRRAPTCSGLYLSLHSGRSGSPRSTSGTATLGAGIPAALGVLQCPRHIWRLGKRIRGRWVTAAWLEARYHCRPPWQPLPLLPFGAFPSHVQAPRQSPSRLQPPSHRPNNLDAARRCHRSSRQGGGRSTPTLWRGHIRSTHLTPRPCMHPPPSPILQQCPLFRSHVP